MEYEDKLKKPNKVYRNDYYGDWGDDIADFEKKEDEKWYQANRHYPLHPNPPYW